MENYEFTKLKQWLEDSRMQLNTLFKAGEVPVVGWLQLADAIKGKDILKGKLEREVSENVKEREQVYREIKNLLNKQEELENKSKHLQVQLQRIEQIGLLEAESQSIAMLCKEEATALAKVKQTMKNEYFMETFDAEDVSTLFSMFNMDNLYPRFKKNDIYKNLAVTVITPAEHLQNNLELSFSEAVTLQWKLKLLENGEEGTEHHWTNCSICPSKKLGLLLREYGMQEADSKEIEALITEWSGYFLVTINPASSAINLDQDHKSKLASCLLKIQRAHQWNRGYNI